MKKGGKVILYHGGSDPRISTFRTKWYYEQLASLNGGYSRTQDSVRLFIVPGMLLAGLHVVRLHRGAPHRVTVARALFRAALALPSLDCGAFGFVLALFDARGQALHDRLSGCGVVADSAPRAR